MTTGIYVDKETGKVVRPEYTDPKEAIHFTYLPIAEGDPKPRFTDLKKDAPRETIHILGVSFHLYAHTPVEALGDHPEPVFPVYQLTDNQVKAIMVKARNTTLEWFELGKDKDENFIRKKMSAPASDFISIHNLPPGEYGKTVKWEVVMTMKTTVQEELLEEKNKTIADLEAQIEQLKRDAKESEKQSKSKNKGR